MSEQHPDLIRLTNVVGELLDSYTDPENTVRTGLLDQAWNANPLMLMAHATEQDESSHAKPGSRPPGRLDFYAHVQTIWDVSRELADDLGVFFATDLAEDALRRLPSLLEPTMRDCNACDRCQQRDWSRCECRHRQVTRSMGYQHSALLTALGWQEERIDWKDVACPECERHGKISVRKMQQRVWCRWPDCDFYRKGSMAILAVAA